MSLDSAALALLILSLIGLGIIIGRKFPTLAAVNPTATAGAIAERKSTLIEQRLRRKFSSFGNRLTDLAAPLSSRAGKVLTRAHEKLVNLEHEYKIRSLPVFLSRRQRRKIDSEISEMLEQAQALMDDKEYAAAEEKAMQAIRLEPRSMPAFELLGQLYLVTKEHGHAKEVYEYLLKLTGDTDAIHEHLGEADLAAGHIDEAKIEFEKAVALNRNVAAYHLELAGVYAALGEDARAFASAQEATRLEPNNPRVLDQFVEVSIAAGKKQFAEDAVARIAAMNPENSKIADWRERISAMDDRPLAQIGDVSTGAGSDHEGA